MASLVDLSTEDFSKRTSGERNVIFVNAKGTRPTPIQMRLFGSLYRYESIFDSATKRVRRPAEGEKSKAQYASHGVDSTGAVKVFIFGKAVAKQIKGIWDDREDKVPVEVLSTGDGLSTEYEVKRIKTAYPEVPDEPKLLDLEKLIGAILGDSPVESPVESDKTESNGVKVEKKDLDWVNA